MKIQYYKIVDPEFLDEMITWRNEEHLREVQTVEECEKIFTKGRYKDKGYKGLLYCTSRGDVSGAIFDEHPGEGWVNAVRKTDPNFGKWFRPSYQKVGKEIQELLKDYKMRSTWDERDKLGIGIFQGYQTCYIPRGSNRGFFFAVNVSGEKYKASNKVKRICDVDFDEFLKKVEKYVKARKRRKKCKS